MRDLIKLFLTGIVLIFAQYVCAKEIYNVVILPDNIVTEDVAVDSYIYNSTSEFFANEVINLLNKTDYIKSPVVSDERSLLKNTPANMIAARDLTNRFKTSYNIDFVKLKRILQANNTKYALLLTSSIDSENYVLRRTFWDFWNIPGASVIDPAYKISTYAALVDTNNNAILWSNTFYKTISVVESRILTRGPSPQTEQLQKIRDYSRMLCPEIAENVQKTLLTPSEYLAESYKIYYDMGNFDNIFTKKYRRWRKEGRKDIDALKSNTQDVCRRDKSKNKDKNTIKEEQKVRADIVNNQTNENSSDNSSSNSETYNSSNSGQPTKIIQPLDFEDQSLFEPVTIKKKWKNNLYGDYDVTRPALRDYDRL